MGGQGLVKTARRRLDILESNGRSELGVTEEASLWMQQAMASNSIEDETDHDNEDHNNPKQFQRSVFSKEINTDATSVSTATYFSQHSATLPTRHSPVMSSS